MAEQMNAGVIAKEESKKDSDDFFQNSRSKILVAVRIRPLIAKESSAGEFEVVKPEDNLIVVSFWVCFILKFSC